MDNNLKLTIPESWDEVSVNDYIKIVNIRDLSPEGMILELLHILSSVDKKTLGTIDSGELGVIEEELRWVSQPPSIAVENIQKDFMIDGIKYQYNRKFDTMTLGELASYELIMKQKKLNEIESYPYVLAIILKKVDKDGKLEEFNADTINELAELFGDKLNIAETMGLLFFFKNGGKDFITILEDCLKQIEDIAKELKT